MTSGTPTPNGELARWRGRLEGHLEEQGQRIGRVQATAEQTRTEMATLATTQAQQGATLDGLKEDMGEVKDAVNQAAGRSMSWKDWVAIVGAVLAMLTGIVVALLNAPGAT